MKASGGYVSEARRRFVRLHLLRGRRYMRFRNYYGRDETWPIYFNRFSAPSSYFSWPLVIRLKIGLSRCIQMYPVHLFYLCAQLDIIKKSG